MTIQKAVHIILSKLNKPLSSRRLAKMALDRHMVVSNSMDPVFSMATTVEKNIRDGIYNHPQLVFIQSPRGRLIGLPGRETPPPTTTADSRGTKIIKMCKNNRIDILRKRLAIFQKQVQPQIKDLRRRLRRMEKWMETVKGKR